MILHSKRGWMTTSRDLFERANALWEAGRLRAAFDAFKSGAEQGDAGCQHNLGYLYDCGIGTRRNLAAALRWYRRAHSGDPSGSAANNIGTIFRDRGARAPAIRWLKRAIALGNIDSALNLAKLYLQRPGGTRRALPYLKMASRDQTVCENTTEQAAALLKAVADRQGRR